MTNLNEQPLDPVNFKFWDAPEGMTLTIGEDEEYPVPRIPLPVKAADFAAGSTPSEKALGDGIYEYLCKFPLCPHAAEYALILQKAYPFLIADIGSQLILLDVKDVQPEGLKRKIALLKILHFLDPENFGLLHKIGRACFDLGLNFSELSRVKPHLKEARLWLEKARRINSDDIGNLNLLGQVCYLNGTYHQSRLYWKIAVGLLEEGDGQQELLSKIARIDAANLPARPLVEDLEAIAAALEHIHAEEFQPAHEILQNLEAAGDLPREMPNPEFFYLLGLSREKCDDLSGAYEGYKLALSLDKNHQPSQQALERVLSEQRG